MQYALFDSEGNIQLIVMTTGGRTPKQDEELIRQVAQRHDTGAGIDWSALSDELNENFHIMGFRKIQL